LEKTHELLIKAVDKRMLAADVPIGVLLSGVFGAGTTPCKDNCCCSAIELIRVSAPITLKACVEQV
jgi:hypothetical protein